MGRRLEDAFTKPLTGMLLVAALLAAIFLFIGKFVAGTVVDFTQGVLFGTWYYDLAMSYGTRFFDPDSFMGCILIGEFGIFTMVPIYLLGLLLPLVSSFYLIMILLEDSGLFHRIARWGEQGLRFLGLSGASAIPLLLGFGCVTAALISAAPLTNRREKLILTVLLSLTIPCSAQLTMLMAAAFTLGWQYILVYFAVMAGIFCTVGLLLNLLLPGKGGGGYRALPPLRLPPLKQILRKTVQASRDFLADAAPTFVLGGIVMAVLNYTNAFLRLHEFFSPVTRGLLRLPPEAADLFILSIVKKDLGAAGLYSVLSRGVMTDAQLTVTLIVMTLFVPCFASVMVLFKEWGVFVAVFIWVTSFFLAFFTGGAVAIFFT